MANVSLGAFAQSSTAGRDPLESNLQITMIDVLSYDCGATGRLAAIDIVRVGRQSGGSPSLDRE